MENTTKKNKGGAWLLLIASAIFMVLLILFKPEWFWLSLPPAGLGFALALDLL